MKTITIEDKTWQKLSRMKIDLICISHDEVINRLFSLVQKFKLADELKSIKSREDNKNGNTNNKCQLRGLEK